MKIYIAVLILFLAAFAGLAAGLFFKRKGPRGGCSTDPRHDKNCFCKSTRDSGENCNEQHRTRARP
jgi:hypothetical protein